MALNDADLFVVQQGNQVYKISAATLSSKVRGDIDPANIPIATETELGAIKVGDNLAITGDGTLSAVIPNGMTIKGQWDPDADAPTAVDGDLYTMSKAGTLNATWGALEDQVVALNDAVIYEGSDWAYLGPIFGGGVISLSGADPIETSGSPETPIISIKASSALGAGSMSQEHFIKLEGIAAGAQVGTVTEVTVTSGRGVTVTDGTTTPNIDVALADKAGYGTVIVADDTALAAGTPLAVVDAAAYKVLDERIDTIEAADTVSVVAGDYITVSEVDGAYTVSADAASETAPGAIEIATLDETKLGVITTHAVTPASGLATYVPRDFSSLSDLP